MERRMQTKIEELPPEQYTEQLLVRKNQLEQLISQKQKEISQAPKERLRVSTNKGTYQYYKITENADTLGTYISKNNIHEAAQLAHADYNKKILPQLQKELAKINDLLSNTQDLPQHYENLHIGRKKLFHPVTLSNKDFSSKWLSVEYHHKPFDPSAPVLQTTTGHRVRSKSELIIADTLTRLGIPYRYEFPIRLKNYTAHPDFYCLNLRTRREFAWEHFGMMDDSTYAQNAVSKIHDYQKSSYFPGKNLIITFETKNTPLSTKQIEHIAREYLA